MATNHQSNAVQADQSYPQGIIGVNQLRLVARDIPPADRAMFELICQREQELARLPQLLAERAAAIVRLNAAQQRRSEAENQIAVTERETVALTELSDTPSN